MLQRFNLSFDKCAHIISIRKFGVNLGFSIQGKIYVLNQDTFKILKQSITPSIKIRFIGISKNIVELITSELKNDDDKVFIKEVKSERDKNNVWAYDTLFIKENNHSKLKEKQMIKAL